MPHIESYSFGRIVIDGKTYTSDVIILPDRVISGWWRRAGHSLCPEDIPEVIKEKPDVFIIGRGSSSVMTVPESTLAWIRDQGIEPMPLASGEAVDSFNRLRAEKRVAAGLHLTC